MELLFTIALGNSLGVAPALPEHHQPHGGEPFLAQEFSLNTQYFVFCLSFFELFPHSDGIFCHHRVRVSPFVRLLFV